MRVTTSSGGAAVSDMLQGSSGNDWFIYRAGEDKVVGQIEAVN